MTAPPHPEAPSLSGFFFGFPMHCLLLGAMLLAAWALGTPALGDGELAGVSDQTWFAAAVGVAVVHQLYVWIGFRGQLLFGGFTRLFGKAGFAVWCAGFFPMLLARPVLVAVIGLADPDSLALPEAVAVGAGIALLVPTLYTFYSVARFFGMARAAGGDHFDARYRDMPLVRRGAFKLTSNAMCTLAFLGLWSIALLCRSQAALVAALFQHAYIWVHWAYLERPDMAYIYEGTPLR
jgi:hypothetical protein